jgi:N6-L-threonylcarbamoyladenine synthase
MKITIGIDTSNYTTSLAAVDEKGSVIADVRRLLTVKDGERGLRQSHALFQHVMNLPELTEQLMAEIKSCKICSVAASTRPRPVEGSYMPVFMAGASVGKSMAQVMNVPFYEFSHQEGHIAAVCGADDSDREFLSFHLSGGTGEILKVRGCMPIKISGGIKDVSFGQLLDRVGVAAGMAFPAGAELDRLACENRENVKVHFSRRGRLTVDNAILKPIHVEGAYANLSGTEMQCMSALKAGVKPEQLVPELFFHISEAIVRMVTAAADAEGLNRIVFAGGVSASSFIRKEVGERLQKSGTDVLFGEQRLSSDNACGIGMLGMKAFLKS